MFKNMSQTACAAVFFAALCDSSIYICGLEEIAMSVAVAGRI